MWHEIVIAAEFMKTEKYVEVINAHLLIFIGCASGEAKCQGE